MTSPETALPEREEGHAISCRLDELLVARSMTLTQLSERVGVSIVNLSVLKNDRARAIRFSTLTAICRVLECEVGELLEVDRGAATGAAGASPSENHPSG